MLRLHCWVTPAPVTAPTRALLATGVRLGVEVGQQSPGSGRVSALRRSNSPGQRCPSSSISSVSLSVARVPARSRTRKSSSRATSASCATGSPGEAGVSPGGRRVLLRFVRHNSGAGARGHCCSWTEKRVSGGGDLSPPRGAPVRRLRGERISPAPLRTNGQRCPLQRGQPDPRDDPRRPLTCQKCGVDAFVTMHQALHHGPSSSGFAGYRRRSGGRTPSAL